MIEASAYLTRHRTIAETSQGFFEKGFIVMAMFFSSGALIPLYQTEARLNFEIGEIRPLEAMVSYPFYIIAIYLLIKNTNGAFQALWKEKSLTALMALSLLSSLWSDFPAIVFRRGLEFAGLSLLGVYLAMRFKPEEQFNLFAITLALIIFSSAFFVAALHDYGVMHYVSYGENHPGAWRGIFNHKNVLGIYADFAVIVFLLLKPTEIKYHIVKWTVILLSFGMSILSKSGGAIAILFVAVGLVPFYATLRNHVYKRVISYCAAIISVVSMVSLLLMKLETVLDVMGKDTTLTGRKCVWEGTFILLGEKPILGYGYGGFWLGIDSAGQTVRQLCNWGIQHSHNGFIETCINIGLLGFLIFIAGFFRAARHAFRNLHQTDNTKALWQFSLISLIFMANLLENNLVIGGGLIWLILVSLMISLCCETNEKIAGGIRW
ncbi:MAG: O-antigen ligase family protein [Candidatus Magnetominusculus sp. LBB02]|nr:O-antigen ligase family protein [Candidatus Magnetominusculus sp. LBB02]